jgi:glycerol-3-phosphate cytidylyltransferase
VNPVIGYAPGVFDLLHAGHINLLWRAKRLCDVLVVGVVSGRGVMQYKGRWPDQEIYNRIHAVSSLGYVDVVVEQYTTDPTPMLERFRPAKLFHGDDWKELREGHETLARLGIEWVSLPYTEGISTTQLRAMGTPREQQLRGVA